MQTIGIFLFMAQLALLFMWSIGDITWSWYHVLAPLWIAIGLLTSLMVVAVYALSRWGRQ